MKDSRPLHPHIVSADMLREAHAATLLEFVKWQARQPGFWSAEPVPVSTTTARKLSMTITALQFAAGDLAAAGQAVLVPTAHGLAVKLAVGGAG
jgi:hypothetical protein